MIVPCLPVIEDKKIIGGLTNRVRAARTTIWALTITRAGVLTVDKCCLAAGGTSVIGVVAVFFAGIQLCTAVCRADLVFVHIPVSKNTY